jgi:hypothetical protein
MRKPTFIRAGLWIGIAALAVVLSACSSSGSNVSKGDPARLNTQIEANGSASPSQRGLELRVLTVDDSENRVAQALSRYESSLSMLDRDSLKRWRSWGLRLLVVPIDQLDSVLASQDQIQASQIRWMGEFPDWRPIIRTGEIHNSLVRVKNETSEEYQTLAGRPRLLARIWSIPEVSESGITAMLHLDLAIQMTQLKRSNRWGEIKLPTALDEGGLVEELKISTLLDSSSALILVGVDPSYRWVLSDDTDQVSLVHNDDSATGPRPPRARTLGQQMLSTPGTGYVAPGMRYVPPKKVLIVLVPKAGGQYRLLGPTAQREDRRP